MKVSKFSEQQIAPILKQVDVDGLGVDDVCRKAGVSQHSYYRCSGRNDGGLDAVGSSAVGKLASKRKNRRLKQMSMDLSLDKADASQTCCQKNHKACEGARLVDALQGVYQVSIRRACTVLRFQKSSYLQWARQDLRRLVLRSAFRRSRRRGSGMKVIGEDKALRMRGWRVNAEASSLALCRDWPANPAQMAKAARLPQI